MRELVPPVRPVSCAIGSGDEPDVNLRLRIAQEGPEMKASTLTMPLVFLALTTVAAQAQSDTTATAPITAVPITGIAGTALAGSTPGSKVIGKQSVQRRYRCRPDRGRADFSG